MFRNRAKWLFLLTVCMMLCMSAYATEMQADIWQESAVGQVRHQTVTVERGTFEKTVSAQASVYYPIACNVLFEADEARFVEYAVSRGDVVQAGDVLVRFSVEGSESELKRQELSLERMEEDMQAEVRQRENAITQMRMNLSAEKDTYEKQKLSISLRKLQIELEQYKNNQFYNIAQQQKRVEELRSQMSICELCAPMSGIVGDITYKKANAPLQAGELLMTIHSEEVILLKVDDSGGNFRYNMPVSVSLGTSAQHIELSGRVVASDEIALQNERTRYAYIKLDDVDKAVSLRNIKVSAAVIRAENVLLVSRNAIQTENGKFYVRRLVDGMIEKCYVRVGMNGTGQTWLLDGVSEGDALITD